MSKIKNGELDQYGAEPFEQQQFRTASIQGVKLQANANSILLLICLYMLWREHRYCSKLAIWQNKKVGICTSTS